MVPIGCNISIHSTSNKRRSWDQRGREGFNVGPALHHYHCIQEIESKTKSLIITNTAEYLHAYLTHPHVTTEDQMTHTIHFLSAALKYFPTIIWYSQYFTHWKSRPKFNSVENWKPRSLFYQRELIENHFLLHACGCVLWEKTWKKQARSLYLWSKDTDLSKIHKRGKARWCVILLV